MDLSHVSRRTVSRLAPAELMAFAVVVLLALLLPKAG